MNNDTKRQLILSSKGNWFTVEFIKSDGSHRTMNCRLGVFKGVKGTGPVYEQKSNLMTVWDRVAKGYRTINLDTIIAYRGNGVKMTFNPKTKKEM